MKRLLTVFFLMVSIYGFGQVPSNYLNIRSRYNLIAVKTDSGFHVPGYSTIPNYRGGVWSGSGNIGVDTVNNKFYFYSGGAWREAGSGGTYPTLPTPDNPNNWTIVEDVNNPIFSIENMPHPGGVYSESSMYAPSPISINDTLFRVYAKGDATNSIHYWESRDSMRTWSYIDTAIYPSPSPTWDSVDIAFPLAIYDNVNDTIHLYYTGGMGIGGPAYGIGHVAFKSNASHPLTRPSSPMLSNASASSLLGVTVGFIDFSSMVKKDGKFYWFGSYSATDSVYLFAASGTSWTSVDTMWKILGPNIATNYNGVINPTVYKRGSTYYGIFADSRVDADGVRDTSWSMLASMYSPDLLTWTRLPGYFMQPRGSGAWNEKQAYDLQFLKVNGGNYDELYTLKKDTLWGGPLKDQTENFHYGFVSGSFYGCCLDQSGIIYVLPQETGKMNFGITNHNWRNDISFFQRNNTLALNVPDAGPNVRGALKAVDWRRFDAKADSANGYSYIWNNSTGTPQNASYHVSGNGIILGKHSIGSAWNTHTLNVDGYQNSGLVEVLRNASYFGIDVKTTVLGHITRTWTGGSKGLFIQSTYDDGMREQFYRKTHKSIFYPQSDFITFFGEQNDTMRAEFKGANTAGAGVSRTTNGSIVVINNADGYNTTSSALTSYGQQINNTAIRESGGNALTNIGLKVSASGGQNNYALQLVDDSIGTNKVWTDIDGTGKGSWRTPASGGGGGVTGTGISGQLALWNGTSTINGMPQYTFSGNTTYPGLTIGASGGVSSSLSLRDAAGTYMALSSDGGYFGIYGSSTYKNVQIYSHAGGTLMAQFYRPTTYNLISLNGLVRSNDLTVLSNFEGNFHIPRTVPYLVTGNNYHGFTDGTDFRQGGSAFNSFGSFVKFGNNQANQDHYAAFQNVWTKDSSNTMSKVYGFVNAVSEIKAGAITDLYGYYHYSPTITGGSISNHYGIYIPAVTGGSKNLAAYFGDSIQIKDGTEGAGKVLTSDADGLASWQTVGSGSGWGLSGNSITAGVDKFGTTNNTTLRLITNNTLRGVIDSTGGWIIGNRASGYDNVNLNIVASRTYALYIDNSYYEAKHYLKNDGVAYHSGALTAASITTAAPTSGTAKPWKLGEVASVSPTSPNRTIRVEIDGTVYFIAAKTTND